MWSSCRWDAATEWSHCCRDKHFFCCGRVWGSNCGLACSVVLTLSGQLQWAVSERSPRGCRSVRVRFTCVCAVCVCVHAYLCVCVIPELWESIKHALVSHWVIICSHKLYRSEVTSSGLCVCVCVFCQHQHCAGWTGQPVGLSPASPPPSLTHSLHLFTLLHLILFLPPSILPPLPSFLALLLFILAGYHPVIHALVPSESTRTP